MTDNTRIAYTGFIAAFIALFVAGGIGAIPLNANAQDNSENAWMHRCSGEDNKKRCEIAQRLSAKESGQRVVEIAITRLPEKDKVRAVMVLPLGVAIQPGIRLRVDDGKTYSAGISHCLQDGCYAYLEIPGKLLKAMKRGKAVRLAMATHQGKQMTIPMSLMGFTASYNKLVK